MSNAKPAWLAPALAFIPQWLAFQMRAAEQPGCAIAVAWKGEIVLEAAFGHADLGAGELLTPRHRFRVASHSKSFTAAAILKLREQGRLRLDDTAGHYVQGLHPEIAAATIAQLLSHTAGIVRDGPDSAYWAQRAPFLDEAALRAELAAAPIIPANTRLKYSNHGFGLAGLIIEAITCEPWGVWMAREIVAAAGLTETTPDVPLPAGAPLAHGHGGKTLLGRRPVIPGDQSTHALAAATGFVSTAAELAKFFTQLSPGAATSFLSVASRREMTRPQWKDAFSPIPRSYGLGIITDDLDGWSAFGHSGGFPGYITRTAVIPERDLAISCLTNAVDGPSHIWLEGAVAILKRFQTEGPPASALAEWNGLWWGLWGATQLLPVGDKVLLANPALANPVQKVPELTLTGPDQARIAEAGAFASYGETARLVRDAAGAITEVHIAGGRLLPEVVFAAEVEARYG